ncbi:Purine catabolism regulatory protein [Corynebacterium provencense]|uniref:Purine catabolism regulatory protein n=1 Tax=Corynebacterium provencense TaxID=1737425 RepID=A0A2Z3YLN0_9CORY|nr:PucR family transcriptional regulator [Corynebacterium provencense]AWT25075.1 Purine catabolism regulatory protein [Corynebacterium provencense]
MNPPTISPLTIADILALPEAASGAPRVLTGEALLSRPVRWIHVAEQASSARLLDGGELLLTTGVGWPAGARERSRFVANCAASGAVGLAVELGGTWDRVPGDVIDASRRYGLPLIVFTTEIRFARLTREVHETIVRDHLTAVEATAEVADTFTRMIHNGAATGQLVTAASRLLGCPVVLEDVGHRVVVAEEAGLGLGELLDGWSGRSAEIVRPPGARDDRSYTCTVRDGEFWTVAPVHVRGRNWGRLLAYGSSGHPAGVARVLGQAAVALAIDRLSSAETSGWSDLVRTAAMARLLNLPSSTTEDTRAALTASGFPVEGRQLTGLEIEIGGKVPDAAAVADAIRGGVTGARVLAARSDTGTGVTAAVSAASGTGTDVLDGELRDALAPFVVGTGPTGDPVRLRIIRGPSAQDLPSLLSSIRRAQAYAAETPHWWWTVSRDPGVPELVHVEADSLAPVLGVLADDVRVQAFAEETLGPVLRYDARNGTDLLDVLRTVVQYPQSRARAAKAVHLSRTSFYNRLATLERLLGADLADGDSLFRIGLALRSRGTRLSGSDADLR